MGIGRVPSGSPRRAYYPSGPWVDGNGNRVPPPNKIYESSSSTKIDPNPKPDKYQVLEVVEDGKYLLMKLKYDGCTTYEGTKVLLFENVKLIDLMNQKLIDPHFSDDRMYKYPMARFVPTKDGWNAGLKFIAMMNNIDPDR